MISGFWSILTQNIKLYRRYTFIPRYEDNGKFKYFGYMMARLIPFVTGAGIIAVLMEAVTGSRALGLVEIFLFFYFFIEAFIGIALGIIDHWKFRSLKKLKKSGTVESGVKAYPYLSNRYDSVEISALEAVHNACSQQPGKFIKYIDKDPETVIKDILPFVTRNEIRAQRSSVGCLMWLSRDYPNLLVSHRELFASLLQSTDSHVQYCSAIILGNIGMFDSDRTDEYVKTISLVVEDQDAEVREAAAISLGKLSSPHSRSMLKQLTTDSDPAVREEAKGAIEGLV